jgi:hypothetical protein
MCGDGNGTGDIRDWVMCLWRRCHGTTEERLLMATWPIDMPPDWLERVNRDDEVQELESLRRSVQ